MSPADAQVSQVETREGCRDVGLCFLISCQLILINGPIELSGLSVPSPRV